MRIRKIYFTVLILGLSACGGKDLATQTKVPDFQDGVSEHMDCAQSLAALKLVQNQQNNSFKKGVFYAFYCKNE